MRHKSTCAIIAALSWVASTVFSVDPSSPVSDSDQTVQARVISRSELRDKIAGAWLGQMTGVYYGLPFELLYFAEPVPFDVTRFYNTRNKGDAKINDDDFDMRGCLEATMSYLDGGLSDDDTDMEFLTLHAVEEFGLGITYEQISPLLAESVHRRIWVSTERAVKNIRSGRLMPPATGTKANNKDWSDLMASISTEIWGAFYPGMTGKAAAGAEWFGRISNDDYAVYLAKAHASMYSAACFETDVDKLIAVGLKQIPPDNILHQGFLDVIRWSRENPEWRTTRKLIFDKYFGKYGGNPENPGVDALPNGLMGVMALLYGKGDFKQTLTIATSAGLDCDNQPATMGGLIGMMFGARNLPQDFLLHYRSWFGDKTKPYNDTYVNITRDGLPTRTAINAPGGIVDRILKIAETAILANGGTRRELPGEEVEYVINTDL